MEIGQLTGKKIIIFGAGLVGKRALVYFGSRSVKCFADNNKAGEFYCGKHVISFEELCMIHKDYDVVLAVTMMSYEGLKSQLIGSGINHLFFRDILSIGDFDSNPRLAQFKNIYKGERCFIVGNGPSLRPEDLEVLQKNNIASFACNRIYKIFDKTEWRPNFLFVSDLMLMNIDFDVFLDLQVEYKFFVDLGSRSPEEQKVEKSHYGNVYFFNAFAQSLENNKYIPFSHDPSRLSYGSAYTVVYVILQWAAYMGFSEIYLLGVDANYRISPNEAKPGEDTDHFSEDYIDANYSHILQAFAYNMSEVTANMVRGYTSAEAYSREHGFRIYNATRGGKLDVFERVNFDSLF